MDSTRPPTVRTPPRPARVMPPQPRTATLADLGPEPYRLLFPLAVLAGVVGVSLWPLHVWGLRAAYPGLEHARLMALGLFGGFILGFLGTVIPRVTSTPSMRVNTVLALGALHAAMVIAWATGALLVGDALAAVLLLGFAGLMAVRLRRRRSDPPPAFVLVALALACAIGGALLALGMDVGLVEGPWARLQRLLAYQGFVLLPILGVGTFILPGFFGADATNHFSPGMLVPGVRARAIRRMLAFGLFIVLTFPLEAWGWLRIAYSLRLVAVLAFLWLELPVHRGPRSAGTMGTLVRIAFLAIAAGYAAIGLWPGLRVSLLHMTLIGGFALLTFVVAARVAFAHGGRGAELAGRLRWLWWSGGIMLFAMATRLSADLWPQVQDSHYVYGALAWLVGVAVWARWVLPMMLRRPG